MATAVDWTYPRRSCLSVPGHAVRMHEKALGVSADEVVFDLEDSVAVGAKQQAREAIAATLAHPAWAQRTVAVRINPPSSSELAADLELVDALRTMRRLTFVVPKVEAPDRLLAIADRIDPGIGLQALIETPAGIEAAGAIARSTPRLCGLILGYADLATALGRRGAERHVERWLYHQEAVLAAARAAGVQAIDGPFMRLGERLALARVARAARELGFDGKWAIHPEQVEALNRAFSATERELRWAGAVSRALAGAADTGDAAVRVEGAMVDEAMRAHAERLLALPRRAAALPRKLTGPAYYEDLAIGQSTGPSGRVLGNLFYRGLAARAVHLGVTLRTTTTVVAKRRASSSGGQVRGMVLLHVTAADAEGEVVLDYHRCPLLPAREDDRDEAGDDIRAAADRAAERDVHDLIPAHWRLDGLRREPLGTLFEDLRSGRTWSLEAGETVSCAPELARLSLNLAMTHTDATAGAHGQRLVYGGQVIGIAASHLTKLLPDLATVLAWRSCDHLGPTFEGDLLRSEITLEELEPLPDGGLLGARILVSAQGEQDDDPRPVLDWRLSALMP